jgi:cell division transport system permease protein
MNRAAHALEDRVDVTLTFRTATPAPVLTQLKSYALSLPQVKSVEFISAQDALQRFRARYASQPKILAALEELSSNPLGAQMIVKAREPDQYPFIVQALQSPQYAPFIQKQTYEDHRGAIVRIQAIADQVRLAGSILVALFALFGLLTVVNAVRVAVYTQREEIAIMRLVGASSLFIRAPFVLQTVWFGVVALVAASLVTYGAIAYIDPALRPVFDGDVGLLALVKEQGPRVFLLQLGTLVVLMSLTAWMAVGRYIRR